METNQQNKKITLAHTFAWIFGVLFLLAGIGTIATNLTAGLFILGSSLFILPPLYNFIKTKTKINITKGVRILIVIILLGVSTVFLNPEGYKEAYVSDSSNKKEETKKDEIKKEEAQKERISVTSISLYREFEANGVATEEKYKDKILVVTGVIGSIDRDIMNSPFVTLQSDNPYITAVQCMFAETEVSSISSLTKGQSVTVEGELSGTLLYPLLRNCKVTK